MYPLLDNLKHTTTGNFFLIAGPCVIEDETTPFLIAEQLVSITDRLGIPFAFKASYRKANRSRIDSFTGIGDQAGLDILQAIRQRFGIPVVTDIHSEPEAAQAAPYVDVLQIPAFLCRQTSLLEAAAQTGRCVNVKKGQFLSPEAMTHAVDKIKHFGNQNIMLTERGTTFGYQDLVAVAVGCDGIFMETHPNPAVAKSDGANMLRLDLAQDLLATLIRIHRAANNC